LIYKHGSMSFLGPEVKIFIAISAISYTLNETIFYFY